MLAHPIEQKSSVNAYKTATSAANADLIDHVQRELPEEEAEAAAVEAGDHHTDRVPVTAVGLVSQRRGWV